MPRIVVKKVCHPFFFTWKVGEFRVEKKGPISPCKAGR